MKACIVGTGYVGLTTGACLAYLKHDVTCVDVNEEKIAQLRRGVVPFHEPGLAELLNLASDHIDFTTDFADAVSGADVVFIAVGTPSLPDGNPDLHFVRTAGEQIGCHVNEHFTVIVNKSTVPVGSVNWVESVIRDAYQAKHQTKANGSFSVASNPEFLREGSAIRDSLYPDRIVIGSNDSRALEVMHALYRQIVEQSFTPPDFAPRPEGIGAVPIVTASPASAELIKYAANAFLSVKISFANEIGHLAEGVGADVSEIMRGIGLDHRIGNSFLQAGLGWGGSCFGKDSAALVATAREYGVCMRIVQSAREVNYAQRERVVEKLLRQFKILKGRTIGILGLAFKPNTDDLRDAPAIDIAMRLLQRGAKVRAHDPVALEKARREHAQSGIEFCDSLESLTEGADALILATEWPQYQVARWDSLAAAMCTPFILDARNFLDPVNLRKCGFQYMGMGN
jgi:UDPglucose 6-dehydrogenase